MDEVHFLADRMRGAVWEEVILHLPEDVRLVSLSATVSNAEEFGGWIQTVRGDTTVVVDEHRPVPLWQHVMVGKRLFDLFDYRSGDATKNGRELLVDPELLRHIAHRREADRLADWRPRGRGGHRGRPTIYRTPSRPDVVEMLDHEALLPAITFIFSRVGCDAAVKQCLRSSLRLTTDDERARIAEVVDRRCADLSDSDLVVLGYHEWREGLLRGLAAHHAGMLPVFRHTVEELFTEGLVKAVFATETLALGINMPARTVVLERLVKFDGEQHVQLTPGEYTQLTGRAGRRGIDVEGHAVVLWSPDVEPAEVAGLASTRTFPLRSSFAPSYNMTINLVNQMGPTQAHKLLERSFAQYQADRSVSGLVRGIERGERMLDEIAAELGGQRRPRSSSTRGCARRSPNARRRSRGRRGCSAARPSTTRWRRLRRGDIVNIANGRRAGLAVVLEPARDERRPATAGADRKPLGRPHFVGRLLGRLGQGGLDDVAQAGRAPAAAGAARRGVGAAVGDRRRWTIPRTKGKRSGQPQDHDVDPELAGLREQLVRHPAHRLPDREEKARLAERYLRIERDNAQIQQKVAAATNSLARTFDRIVVLLTERGFIHDTDGDPRVTDDGRLLARIYSESDLLVAECLRGGVWEGLAPAELAGVLSAVLYESRGDSPGTPQAADIPTAKLRRALADTRRFATELRADEQRHRISPSREPDEGFVTAVYRWATTGDLAAALDASDIGRTRFTAVGRRLRALVSPGPRSGRPGPQCRAYA